MRSGLRVALVYNLKDNAAVAPDAPSGALAEYDAIETVHALKDALFPGGHPVICLDGDETLLDTVRRAVPDMCFNIAEELRGDAREAAGDRWVRLFRGSHAKSRCLSTLLVRVGL